MGDENIKTVKRIMQDGRRGEIHVEKIDLGNGVFQEVETVYEETLPMATTRRVQKKVVPVVTEQVTTEYGADGTEKTVSEHVPDAETELKRVAVLPDDLARLVKAAVKQALPEPAPADRRDAPAPAKKGLLGIDPSAVGSGDLGGMALVVLLGAEIAIVVWQLFIR